jgi:uncharacterized coiled-coil protein SlyX
METVRNGADSASPIAILTADVGELKLRVGKLEDQVGAVETRLGALAIRVGAMEIRLGAVEVKLQELGERVARLEMAVELLLSEVKDLRASHERDFRLMFGSLVTVAVGLSGMMAKGFGWL